MPRSKKPSIFRERCYALQLDPPARREGAISQFATAAAPLGGFGVILRLRSYRR